MADKVTVPDGKGGYSEIEATKVAGQSADASRQAAVLATESEKAHWERVATTAEKINSFIKMRGRDYNLSVEELAQALYLEVINWKEFWPEDKGGPAQFDALSKEVWDWFQAHKNQ